MTAHVLVDSTEATPARAEARVEHAAVVMELSGDWRLEEGSPRFDDVHDPSGAVRALGFEASALGAWDSSLLIFLL